MPVGKGRTANWPGFRWKAAPVFRDRNVRRTLGVAQLAAQMREHRLGAAARVAAALCPACGADTILRPSISETARLQIRAGAGDEPLAVAHGRVTDGPGVRPTPLQ